MQAPSDSSSSGSGKRRSRKRACDNRSRNWMATLYNLDDYDSPKSVYESFGPKASFAVFQVELAPTTQRKHYQCYVEFSTTMSFAAVKKINDTAHWEVRGGTSDEAYNYCSKLDTRLEGPWEFGVRKAPGTRSDIIALYELAKSGASMREAAEALPKTYMLHFKAFAHAKMLYRPPDAGKIEVHLFIGPSNVGKTTAARSLSDNLWISPLDKGNWYDGYDSHDDVLFDDYYHQYSLQFLLRLLHGKSELVPIKGGFLWWTPKRVFITSNFHPKQWYDYSNREEHRLALYRRITHVWEFDGVKEPEYKDGLDYFGIKEVMTGIKYFY